MTDTANSSPQASLPDSPSRSPSPYPYYTDTQVTSTSSRILPTSRVSDRSMRDLTSARVERPNSSSASRMAYPHPPPSPSNTSQSDDGQDFADLPSSCYNLDDGGLVKKRASGHGDSFTVLQEQGNARLSRRGTLVPASPSSSTGTWIVPVSEIPTPSNLPHEILLHIFKYVVSFPPDLLSCLQVSKAWCLCGVELLWHRPTFYRISSLFKLIAVIRKPDQLFPYAAFVRRLNFTILSSQLEDQLFLRMGACTRLERLTLAGCCHVTDDTLVKVFQATKQLVAIDLTDVSNLTDATLNVLAQNCPRLQGINLTGCKKITSEGVINLAKSCKLLRRVKLCGCENVDDFALLALADHCPVLLELDMINCPKISDKSVREIWKKSFHIRELRLAHCGDLTDDAFPSVKGGSNLSMLSSSQSLAMRAGLGSGRPSDSAPTSRGTSPTRDVNANGDTSLSRTMTAPSLGMEVPSIRFFDHLRILDLTGCNSITDETIEGVVANVPRIKNLILAKCTRLTDESVYSISKLGKNLHYLHLGHVLNITDRAVTHLARSCTRLRYIDLACCPHLTDLCVFELAANLPKLRRIGLVKVVNLTDQAIYSLVDRHTSLERIHLSYCENISVPAIFWLLQRLTRLTHLSLTGVPAFRRPELQAMCRPPPKDFNDHQRQAFCVFSGKGVNELRKYLQQVYADEQRAAQFGDLTPDVRRAFALMVDEETAAQPGQRARAVSDLAWRTPSDQLYFQQRQEGVDSARLQLLRDYYNRTSNTQQP